MADYDEDDLDQSAELDTAAEDDGESDQPSALPLRNQSKKNLVPVVETGDIDPDALENFDFNSLIKAPEAPKAKPVEKGALSKVADAVVDTAKSGAKAVKNFVAPDKDYIPGSVMNDVPKGEPLKQASKAPLAPGVRKYLENQFDGATPEQRVKMASQAGAAGDVWRQREEEYSKRTSSNKVLDKIDPSAEARTSVMVDKGMNRETARQWGKEGARRGDLPGTEVGQASNVDIDVEMREKYAKDPVLSSALGRFALKSYEGYKQGVLGWLEVGADAIDADEFANGVSAVGRDSERRVKAVGEAKNYAQRMFEGAAVSIAQQLPLMLASGGSSAVALGLMAAQSYGQSYLEGRNAGQAPDQARLRAAEMAAMEVIGEKFGLGHAMGAYRKLFNAGDVQGALKMLVPYAAKQVPGEMVTTLGQFAIDKAGAGYGIRTEADLAELKDQLADTIVQTVMQGGIMSAPLKVAQGIRNNPWKRADKAVAGADIAREIDGAINEIPDSDGFTEQEAVRRMSPTGTTMGDILPPDGSVPETTPEPASDIQAQIDSMLDPANPKDAVFIAAGTEVPALPGNVRRIDRPEGVYLTTNADKANQILSAPTVTDDMVAEFLGIPVPKSQVAGENPEVLQARDAEGNVVNEAVGQENGQAVAETVPAGGTVTTTTPEQAQAERAAKVARESIVPGQQDTDIDEALKNVKTVDEDGNEVTVAPPAVEEARQEAQTAAPTQATGGPQSTDAAPPAAPVEGAKAKAPGISREIPKLEPKQAPVPKAEPKGKVEGKKFPKPVKPEAPAKVKPLQRKTFAKNMGATADGATGPLTAKQSEELQKPVIKGDVSGTFKALQKSGNPAIRFIAEAGARVSERAGKPLTLKTSDAQLTERVNKGYNGAIKRSREALDMLEGARAALKILANHKGNDIPPAVMKGSFGKFLKSGRVTTAAEVKAAALKAEKLFAAQEHVIRKNANEEPTDPKDVGGLHDPVTHTVLFRKAHAMKEHIVAHELTHALTTEAINNPTDEQVPYVQALEKLWKHVADHGTMNYQYGLTSMKEFIAEGFSNPDFQFELAAIEYEGTTAWGKFTQMIAKLLGIPHNNAFMELMAIGEGLMDTTATAGKRAGTSDLMQLPNLNINSAPFQRWFGDSKVVDSSGKPLVVYHGTAGDFSTFSETSPGWLSFGGGYYFADSPVSAGEYAKGREGGNVMPVYLSLRNPFVIESTKTFMQSMIRQFGTGGAVQARKSLEAQGYDGLYYKESGTFVAFHPNQIKSAIGNNGEFSASPRIDLSIQRAKGVQGRRFNLPEESRLRYLQSGVQDRFNRIKQIQKAIEAQGGSVQADANIYKADERYHGAAASKVSWFTRFKVKPLFRDMARAGVDPDDVGLFLYAQHAKERNAQIALINPNMPDGGSGMTNAEADANMKSFRADPRYADIKRFADRLLAITQDTRKVMLDGHLVDQDTLDAWDASYKAYVPLKGFETYDDFGAKQAGSGRGYDVRGMESRRALGRESKAGNIIENIIMDHERAINRAEKNKVARALMRFVLANPDSKLWEINKVVYKNQLRKDPSPGHVIQKLETVKDKDRTITVKENGKEYFVLIHDARMFEQLQGEKGALNMTGLTAKAFKIWSAFNRFLATMWTALSPAFVFINAIRDTVTTIVHGSTLLGPGFSAKVVASAPKAAAAIIAADRSKTPTIVGPNGPQNWREWYQQYQDDGGKAGFYMFSELEDKERELRAVYQQAFDSTRGTTKKKAWAKARKAMSDTLDLIMDVNGGIENMNRLAAYRVAIEQYGMSREEAASLAKNLTVNFNRRGSLGPIIGSFYLFFNPAIQGTARMIQAYKDNPAMMSGMLSSMVAVGFMTAAMGDGDEDENGMPYREKIAAYEKEKNIIIPVGGGNHLTLPLPYGYGFFVHLGGLLYDMYKGRPTSAVGWEMMNSALKHFMPIGVNLDNPATMMVPTVGIPILESFTEKKATGQPLMPSEKNPDGSRKPDYQRYWRDTEGHLTQKITTFLAELTEDMGANEPLIDISPETVNNVAKGYLGGGGTFALDLGNTIYQAMTGNTLEEMAGKNSIPIVKNFYKADNGKSDTAYFMEHSEKALSALERFKALQEKDDPVSAKRAEKLTDLAFLGKSVQEVRKAVGKMNKVERAIRADKEMGEAEKKEALKEIADEKRKLYSWWNASMYRKQRGLPEKD
jgi:hypothetical protein